MKDDFVHLHVLAICLQNGPEFMGTNPGLFELKVCNTSI